MWFLLRDPDPSVPSPVSESTFDEFPVGGIPRWVTTTTDGIWVAFADQTVVKLDPESGSRLARTRLPFLPGQMIATGGSVWVGAIEGTDIARLNARNAALVDQVEVGTTPQSLAADADSLFVAAFDDGTVERVDPKTAEVSEAIYRDGDAFPSSVTSAFESLWVSDVVQDIVTRLPVDGESQEIPVGDSPTRMVAGEDAIWVANFNARSVSRIDPGSGDVTEILVGGKPGAIAFAGSHVWVLRPGSDSFVLIDTESGRWTGHAYAVAEAPQDITAGQGYVWIVSQEGTLTRVPIP